MYRCIYVSQGSAATDLRGGGSFKSTFLRRFFLNLTVKNIMKIGPRLPTFCHLAIEGPVIMTHCVYIQAVGGRPPRYASTPAN